MKRTADELKLPESEEYALLFDESKVFVSEEALSQLDQGFLLAMTAAPVSFDVYFWKNCLQRYYAYKLRDNLTQMNDIESSLLRLSSMSADPVFAKAFYENTSIDLLYSLLEDETIKRYQEKVNNFFLVHLNFYIFSS